MTPYDELATRFVPDPVGDRHHVRLTAPGCEPVVLGPYPNPARARDQAAAVRRFVANTIRATAGHRPPWDGPDRRRRPGLQPVPAADVLLALTVCWYCGEEADRIGPGGWVTVTPTAEPAVAYGHGVCPACLTAYHATCPSAARDTGD